ncbi:hypothetical protein BD410DRAFT_833359 [Rickenella mellea]|uniref:BTB domain-containing protein n=1 Tax=Rickenella mellea TaxID=50990 RepID=A0A4Y7PD78_9AGAM|nr:hypothetical protein BD410DRAFT_833359 [Rickenella mellea]
MESTNEHPKDQPEITKGEPWFEDGNVVLISKGTAFCVHKSQLANRSEVFKDLFSVPHTHSPKLFENRDVVELRDEPDDLRSFLVALYDGIALRSRNLSDFLAIAQVARMTHKYMSQSLHQTILRYLITINPVHDERLDDWHGCQKSHWRACDVEPWPYFHPSLMISLAKDIEAEFLLPFAYYRMAIRPARDNFVLAVDTPARGQLSKSDMVQIIFLQEMFRIKAAGCLDDAKAIDQARGSQGCQNTLQCHAAFKALIVYMQDELPRARDPLSFFRDALWYLRDGIHDQACRICLGIYGMEPDYHQRELWNALPNALGLLDWKELVPAEYCTSKCWIANIKYDTFEFSGRP